MVLDYSFYLMILFCICLVILLFLFPVLVTEKTSTKFNLFTSAIIIIPGIIFLYLLIRFLIYSL